MELERIQLAELLLVWNYRELVDMTFRHTLEASKLRATKRVGQLRAKVKMAVIYIVWDDNVIPNLQVLDSIPDGLDVSNSLVTDWKWSIRRAQILVIVV